MYDYIKHHKQYQSKVKLIIIIIIIDNTEKKLKIKEPNYVDYNIAKKGNQQFDLNFDVIDFPELKSFKGVNFEVFTDKKYDKSFTKKTWSEVTLQRFEDKYFAIFKNNNEIFKIQVRPILKGQAKL